MTYFICIHLHICILCADCLHVQRASPCSVLESKQLHRVSRKSSDLLRYHSVLAFLQGGCLVITE